MIFVDSSVWIDYFNGEETPVTNYLDAALAHEPILLGDLVLMEVLQGFQNDKDFRIARNLLLRFPVAAIGGAELALRAAANYRVLRKRGVTVRKSIDVLIGTYCIAYDLPLLHTDRDFEPMARYLGLNTVQT